MFCHIKPYNLATITTKLCGANEAQRSLRPNKHPVMRGFNFIKIDITITITTPIDASKPKPPTYNNAVFLFYKIKRTIIRQPTPYTIKSGDNVFITPPDKRGSHNAKCKNRIRYSTYHSPVRRAPPNPGYPPTSINYRAK